jgi:hypothetical protein
MARSVRIPCIEHQPPRRLQITELPGGLQFRFTRIPRHVTAARCVPSCTPGVRPIAAHRARLGGLRQGLQKAHGLFVIAHVELRAGRGDSDSDGEGPLGQNREEILVGPIVSERQDEIDVT